MKIANIVTTDKIDLAGEFNVVNNIDNIIVGLPTLIIGWKFTSRKFPNYDITSTEVEPNLYWIFKRSENRDKFEEGLLWFTNKVYRDLVEKIPYIFIDPLQYSRRKLVKILRKVYSLKKVITYITNDMIYIYGDELIFGVDLKLMKYVGLNPDKLKNKIKAHSSVFLYDDNILIEYKKTVEGFSKKARYMPFLHSIKNE